MLRESADFVKALAMGADAVAIASAGLIAAACLTDLPRLRMRKDSQSYFELREENY